jgi:hypothetical protein
LINPTVNFQSSSNLTCLQHLRFYNNRLAIDHSLPPKFLSPLASCAPPFLGYVPALLDAPFNLVNWFLLISQPLNIGMSLRPLLLTPLLIYFSLTEELIYPTLIWHFYLAFNSHLKSNLSNTKFIIYPIPPQ